MRFENTQGSHNKYYIINMLETPKDGVWVVFGESGVIGGSPRRYIKAKGTFEECQRVFLKTIKKRLKNGYKKIE